MTPISRKQRIRLLVCAASFGMLAACGDQGPSIGAEGLTREVVLEFLNDQVEASEQQDISQLGEYMSDSIYIRLTAAVDGMPTDTTECTGRTECMDVLEEGMVAISDYEITIVGADVAISSDGRSAEVEYVQEDSGVIDGIPFRAETQSVDEYAVEGRDLVIVRSEGHTEISLDT